MARAFGQQGWTLRARLREPRLGLGLFAPRRHAVADAIADQRDQVAIGLDLLLDDGDARLQAAQPEIGIGRVGRHRDARTGMQGLGRLGLGAGGLGLAAQAAGQVELPARAQAELGIALVAIVAGQGRADPAQRRFQRLPLARRRALDIEPGQPLRAGIGGRRARLRHARLGGGQVEVLRQRALDQLREHRIVEAEPPGIERDRFGRGARLQRAQRILAGIVRRERRIGRPVVGADRAAAQERCGQRGGGHCRRPRESRAARPARPRKRMIRSS